MLRHWQQDRIIHTYLGRGRRHGNHSLLVSGREGMTLCLPDHVAVKAWQVSRGQGCRLLNLQMTFSAALNRWGFFVRNLATPQSNEAMNTDSAGVPPSAPWIYSFTSSSRRNSPKSSASLTALGPGTRPVLFLLTTSRLSFKYPFPSELPFLFARVQSVSCVTELG